MHTMTFHCYGFLKAKVTIPTTSFVQKDNIFNQTIVTIKTLVQSCQIYCWSSGALDITQDILSSIECLGSRVQFCDEDVQCSAREKTEFFVPDSSYFITSVNGLF